MAGWKDVLNAKTFISFLVSFFTVAALFTTVVRQRTCPLAGPGYMEAAMLTRRRSTGNAAAW
jgi:hypothetical protein